MRDFGALCPQDRARLLGVVRAHLAPGGALLFDVDSLAAFDAVRERSEFAADLHDGFYAPRPYFGFHHTFRYEAEQVTLDKYVVVRPEGTRTHYVWVRYYSPATLAEELAASEFEVVELLGDVAGAKYDPAAPHFATVAAPPCPTSTISGK